MSGAEQIQELLVRGATIGVLLALAFAIARTSRLGPRITGLSICIAGAAHVLTQFPPAFAVLPAGLDLVVQSLSIMGSGLFWAFATELFQDRDRFDIRRFFPAAILLVVGMLALTQPQESQRWYWIAFNLIGVGLLVHVLVIIVAGWRNDLVESRRRLRAPLLAGAGLYVLAVNGVEASQRVLGPVMSGFPSIAAVVLLLVCLSLAVAFLRADETLVGTPIRPDAKLESLIPARDRAILSRLNRLLDEDQVWRRESLGIGELARLTGESERRLRALINGQLGYRNFAAFLNARRIAAAKALLADANQARLPVSSIAFDVGFGSLGPFNRAFKAATGCTPTEWRASAPENGSPGFAEAD